MNRHPGGQAHTRRMLALAELSPGASVLDLGAGGGETLALLRNLGYAAAGIDLLPRAETVEPGDLLRAPYPDGSFDAVVSECAFFVSGDRPAALREARRLLRPAGKLLLSDVFFEDPEPLLEDAGFAVLHAEDMTEAWREYYLEALWRGDTLCCEIPRGKCRYWILIGKKV
jgi:SAM-dependent methyltransferase